MWCIWEREPVDNVWAWFSQHCPDFVLASWKGETLWKQEHKDQRYVGDTHTHKKKNAFLNLKMYITCLGISFLGYRALLEALLSIAKPLFLVSSLWHYLTKQLSSTLNINIWSHVRVRNYISRLNLNAKTLILMLKSANFAYFAISAVTLRILRLGAC